MSKKTKQIIGFAVGALFLTGCQAGAQTDNEVAVMGSSHERKMTQVEEEKEITLDKAKNIAFEHAGIDGEEAIFDDEEYDRDDRKYELEFVVDDVEYEYDIDAVTGEILEAEKEVNRPEVRRVETDLNQSNLISLDNAVEIALNDAGFKENEVEWDDREFDKSDRLYELEFKASGFEYEYDIDAVTGSIIKREKDKEDDSQHEAAEEIKNETPQELSKDQAIDIALKHAGVSQSDIRLDEIKRDSDDGVRYWDIEFYAGNYEYEYEIQVSNGTILDVEREKTDEYKEKVQVRAQENKAQKNKPKELTQEEALMIALKHAGLSRADITLEDSELDSDDGVRYWEIEFNHGEKEYEYEIHVNTGDILDVEVELD
ncbi:hypothetical protein GCM10008932_24320 [Alkalibacterium iburiense]|uniref:PepSY domain-containing protein n=1 Tax=Alkalibacterium iburiense TaxID=290589 RepID=A0ABP3HN57_9LACT